MPLPSAPLATLADTHARRTRRKDARPGELLAAALHLFVEKGFAATRVEEVAKLAGVSKGTLFLYFPSKEDLFKAVVRENISGHLTQWSDEIDHFEGSSHDMLRCCLHSWWTHIGSTQASGIPKLMMSEAHNFPELGAFYRQEVMQPGTALIERVLQRGIQRGEFRAVDVHYAAYMVLAPLLLLALWRHSPEVCTASMAGIDPETYLAMHISTLLHGLSVAPALSLLPVSEHF